ncbi:lasso peptide biosynthesis B2 protein [Streptomyces sp. XH2]|uniref:lasso peptide biosynthesis B2 protein n=1 Tax=Streptomyces sp. XH2 TaxID=3412483 RepID=UPI003C79EE55
MRVGTGTAPQLFRAHLPGGSAAVMDIRTGRGRWHHLNTTAALLWHRLTDGASLERTVDGLVEAFVGQGADEGAVRADLAALVGQMRELGLLGARTAAAPEPVAVAVRPAVPTTTPVGAGDRVVGVVGMATALILLRCTPIRVSITAARALARIPVRPAAPEEADRLVAAVRRAARFWPGRSACLEESLACYLAAVLRGRSVAWVVGARTAPAGAHAWNEAGGQVVGQDAADRLWPYAPALRIEHRTE